jgi:hypothetical protein
MRAFLNENGFVLGFAEVLKERYDFKPRAA